MTSEAHDKAFVKAMNLHAKGKMKDAYRQFTKLADQQQHALSQYMLGRMLIDKDAPTDDMKLGVSYMSKAAQAGATVAMCHLGFVLRRGIGVEKQEELAFQWYQKAAQKGDIGKFVVVSSSVV